MPQDGPPDEAAVVAMLARYGATVLGPPLS